MRSAGAAGPPAKRTGGGGGGEAWAQKDGVNNPLRLERGRVNKSPSARHASNELIWTFLINSVNFGANLKSALMVDIERPGPKRWHSAIPNTSQLVDSRETNGEKCAAASRRVEFLSGQHRVEIQCLVQQQTLSAFGDYLFLIYFQFFGLNQSLTSPSCKPIVVDAIFGQYTIIPCMKNNPEQKIFIFHDEK